MTKKPTKKPAKKPAKAKPTTARKPAAPAPVKKPKRAAAPKFRKADGTVGDIAPTADDDAELAPAPMPTPEAVEEARAFAERGEQVEVPGAERERDEVLEAQWRNRINALRDRAAAKARIDEAEDAIEKRFAEIAAATPDHPHAHAYTTDDGIGLTPKNKFKLGIKYPPKRKNPELDRAEAAMDRAANDVVDHDDGSWTEPAPDTEPTADEPADERDDDATPPVH